MESSANHHSRSAGTYPWLAISLASVFAACLFANALRSSVSGSTNRPMSRDSRPPAVETVAESSEIGKDHTLLATTESLDTIEPQEPGEKR